MEKARLYATAAGCHEMYLNGSRCGDDYLAPGKSEYRQILYYQTYDVTDLLEQGENTLACQLGMGWYNGGPIGSTYGTNIGLKAKLIVTYTDGSEQTVDTNAGWLSFVDGPVRANRFYVGEHTNVQTVGFIGYPILYYTLSQHGHTDTVFTLLEQTKYPSILYYRTGQYHGDFRTSCVRRSSGDTGSRQRCCPIGGSDFPYHVEYP